MKDQPHFNEAKLQEDSKFGFLCEPKQEVHIEGLTPNLVVFSEDNNLSNNIAVKPLALILKDFSKIEKLTVLYMADDKIIVLRRTIQLLSRRIPKI